MAVQLPHYMLPEVVDDDDEVQELNFQNSSGIRTSARLQVKAWQEMKTHESASKSARISLSPIDCYFF